MCPSLGLARFGDKHRLALFYTNLIGNTLRNVKQLVQGLSAKARHESSAVPCLLQREVVGTLRLIWPLFYYWGLEPTRKSQAMHPTQGL